MEYVSTSRNQQWVSIWITFLSKSASRFLEHTQQIPKWQSWTPIDLKNWTREAIEAALSLILWKIEDRLRRARQVWGGTSTSFPRRLRQKDPPESCWGCGLTFRCISASESPIGNPGAQLRIHPGIWTTPCHKISNWISQLENRIWAIQEMNDSARLLDFNFIIFIIWQGQSFLYFYTIQWQLFCVKVNSFLKNQLFWIIPGRELSDVLYTAATSRYFHSNRYAILDTFTVLAGNKEVLYLPLNYIVKRAVMLPTKMTFHLSHAVAVVT